jgi:protein-tyrosine phosphatase
LVGQISKDYEAGAGVWSICYGGRNRSNLFLALLLIDSGFTAKTAVALLKHTRKGSFQNKRLERYLLEHE